MLASDAILVRLSGVSDLSARSSDLVSVRDDLPLFLAASAVRLSSARWHCSRRLIWLRDWLRGASHAATHVTVKAAASDIAEENRCATPRRLAGRTLLSIQDHEFDASTGVPDHHTTSPSSLTTTARVDKSTTSVYDGKSSTSPGQYRRVNFRRSDEQEHHSRVIHGNETMYQDVEVEQKSSSYTLFHDDDLALKPFTHQGLMQDPLGDQFGSEFGDASTKDPDELAVTGRRSRTSTEMSTLVAVAATIGVTFVLVVVILTVIFRLLRGQKPPPPADLNVEAHPTNAAKQRQHNGTLYFMPTSVTTNGDCLSAPTSRTELDLKLAAAAGTDGAKSVGEIASLALTANARDAIGRSVTLAEPLRSYKWEDF